MSLQLQMIRLIGLEIVCWLILRSIFDSADNANASTNGFYVATGAASSPLAKYDLSYSPLDSMA